MIAKIFVCALFYVSHVLALLEISYNHTATDVDPEHKVAYWREDLGINIFHWHWHRIYPFTGPDEAFENDRPGEVFYYVHHQIMTRMNAERLSNGLDRAVPLDNFRQPLPEAYFPKLNLDVAGIAWPGRPANSTLSDVKRGPLRFTIEDMERAERNIMDGIKAKALLNKQGNLIPLDEKTGIDILAKTVVAIPPFVTNSTFYGDLHGYGHYKIASIHDPDNRYLEPFGLMAFTAVSMRDPLFYRWHSYMDNLFRKFKDSLPPYSNDQLSFNEVTVTKVSINSTSDLNTLNTYWTTSDIELSRGLDLNLTTGPIPARITHLNHDEFSYIITANNANKNKVVGTVRIFIAPRFDENKRLLSFNDQRFLMIEMDKFPILLKPGTNTITRQSTESAITIPFDTTFRDLNYNRPPDKDIFGISKFAYCGCGWPQHMLVPRGTKEGYPMDLFVMISNYQQDKIDHNKPDKSTCRAGISFCGLKDRGLKYPDAQAMGYPFDRTSNATSMGQFQTPNMLVQQITVKFSDTIKTAKNTPVANGYKSSNRLNPLIIPTNSNPFNK